MFPLLPPSATVITFSPAILTLVILTSASTIDTVILMGRPEAKVTKSLGKKGDGIEDVNALISSTHYEFALWRKIIMWIHIPQHPSSSSQSICSDQSLFLEILNCKTLCQRNHLSYMQAGTRSNKRSLIR